MTPRPALAVTLSVVLSIALAAAPPAHARAPRAAPATPTPIMPLDQVRIGMTGYGLTVFHGTEIEPFPVEVVSVIRDSSPQRGTIWIRCTDPRLEKSGPVQGMSGSPIYLWEPGEGGTLGEGGRLIGAFAFGYAMVKECLAGVQPIELMRRVGARATAEPDDVREDQAADASLFQSREMLGRLQALATARGVSALHRFRLDLTARLMDRIASAHGLAPVSAPPASAALPAGPGFAHAGEVTRMMLPMSVGSPAVASLVTPLLEPLGLAPFAAAGGTVSGAPPVSIDPDAVKLAPGSVLAIPLAYGDLDLSAAGTVTDVMPDGTVLGFGHPMFGQGEAALPMATGYVHFVAPLITISFKKTGSLQIKGTIVEDASAGIAGIGERLFKVAPVTVGVQMPGLTPRQYHYQVVDHPQLTPVLAMIVTMQSLTAEQGLPLENTLYVTGEMVFTGDRRFPIDLMLAGARGPELFFELAPTIMAMMNNPHENLKLVSMDLSAEVEPVLRVGALTHARLATAQVAPGESIEISATVQPYGKPPQTLHGSLKVPAWLDEGDYQLMICDAATYAMITLANRPHLMATESVDDLAAALRTIMSIRPDAIYAVLQLPEQGLAVGGSELPRLPSSRKAMIATPTSTLAVPFMETAEAMIPTDVVVQGQMPFTVAVRRNPVSQPAASDQAGDR